MTSVAEEPSPLRRARLARNWTLDDVVEEIDLRTATAPRLLASVTDLREALLATVNSARECLVAAGSRSRDAEYLEAIKAVLADRPALVHYRVLFGPPHHQALKDHLLQLLEPQQIGELNVIRDRGTWR